MDEFHEVFFNQEVKVAEYKVVSLMQKLMKAEKLVGLSATFRGDTGMSKITNIMEAKFLETSAQFLEREL